MHVYIDACSWKYFSSLLSWHHSCLVCSQVPGGHRAGRTQCSILPIEQASMTVLRLLWNQLGEKLVSELGVVTVTAVSGPSVPQDWPFQLLPSAGAEGKETPSLPKSLATNSFALMGKKGMKPPYWPLSFSPTECVGRNAPSTILWAPPLWGRNTVSCHSSHAHEKKEEKWIPFSVYGRELPPRARPDPCPCVVATSEQSWASNVLWAHPDADVSSFHVWIALEDPCPSRHKGFRSSLSCWFSVLKIVRVSSHYAYPTVPKRGMAVLHCWDVQQQGESGIFQKRA